MAYPSAADAVLELDVGALCFRCRRVLSKAQLAGVQNPDPLVQTGLRIIRPSSSRARIPALAIVIIIRVGQVIYR